MTPSSTVESSPPPNAAADVIALVARLILGVCFVYMGISKALLHDPQDFLKQVHEYGVVSNPFILNSIGSALPWFEIFSGLLLLLGIGVRGTALVVAAMLVPFTLLVLRRGLAIADLQHLAICAVKFNCGCGSGDVFLCTKLLENSALIALALWLVWRPVGTFCARFALIRNKTSARPATSIEAR